ncbi:MAG: TetR/AcrR family transcriptional regulator [Aureliella sp.]
MTQASELRLTDRKRAAILGAAVDEFCDRGFYAASMNRIAELAEVSKRTLYKHFESKETLFEAIVEELLVRVESIPYRDFDPDQDLEEQLAAVVRAEVQIMSSEPVQALARAGISRVIAEPEVARSIDHDRFLLRSVRWLKQAKAAGHFSEMKDVEFAAQQFCGLVQQFAFWPTILKGEGPLTPHRRKKIVGETVQMFLSRYGA